MNGSACYDASYEEDDGDLAAGEAHSHTRIATHAVRAPSPSTEAREVRVIAGPRRTLGMISVDVQVGAGLVKVYFTHAGAEGFATGANGEDAKAAVAIARRWVQRGS